MSLDDEKKELIPEEDVLGQEVEETTLEVEETIENEGDYFAPVEVPVKKPKVKRKDLPPAERRRKNIRDIIITCVVIGLVLVFVAICALVSWIGREGNYNYIATVESLPEGYSDFEVEFDAELGYYVFSPKEGATAEDFTVLQLTDIHIGAGAFSATTDRYALQRVVELVWAVQPDLVIVTGDVAYPVPFQSGTFDNKAEATMFGELMDALGVYWTITFGNHDTEAYSLYNRDEIGEYYQEMAQSGEWEKCLFRVAPELYEETNNIDISGVGNDMILLKDSDGFVVHAFVMIDSHSYTDGDYFGIAWKYDNIQDDQVYWYASEITRLSKASGYTDGEFIANTAYFHIPLREYGYYWEEYRDGAYNVEYLFGKAGESGEKSYPGMYNDTLFESMILYNGQGTFCGHDHYNNYSILVTATVYYTKDENGIMIPIEITDEEPATYDETVTHTKTGTLRLTYGMSIDYLAYIGIANKVEQRGGTEIKISLSDGTISARQRPSTSLVESGENAFI